MKSLISDDMLSFRENLFYSFAVLHIKECFTIILLPKAKAY